MCPHPTSTYTCTLYMYMYIHIDSIVTHPKVEGGSGIRQKLAKLGQQVFLILKQLRDLGVDLRFTERRPAGGATLLNDPLLLLVGVQDLQEGLVDVRVVLKAILWKAGVRAHTLYSHCTYCTYSHCTPMYKCTLYCVHGDQIL